MNILALPANSWVKGTARRQGNTPLVLLVIVVGVLGVKDSLALLGALCP